MSNQARKESLTEVPNAPSFNEWVNVKNPIEEVKILGEAPETKDKHDYIVATYYFGNFHVDPRNEVAHGKGWRSMSERTFESQKEKSISVAFQAANEGQSRTGSRVLL